MIKKNPIKECAAGKIAFLLFLAGNALSQWAHSQIPIDPPPTDQSKIKQPPSYEVLYPESPSKLLTRIEELLKLPDGRIGKRDIEGALDTRLKRMDADSPANSGLIEKYGSKPGETWYFLLGRSEDKKKNSVFYFEPRKSQSSPVEICLEKYQVTNALNRTGWVFISDFPAIHGNSSGWSEYRKESHGQANIQFTSDAPSCLSSMSIYGKSGD